MGRERSRDDRGRVVVPEPTAGRSRQLALGSLGEAIREQVACLVMSKSRSRGTGGPYGNLYEVYETEYVRRG